MAELQAELTGVRKSFGSVRALDGVDFAVGTGEIHALVGENGAGKSTLMRVLAGQMAADAGDLRLEGREVDLAFAPGYRRGVGFVEQEGGLVAELTGAENLLLADPQGFRADRATAGGKLVALAERFGGTIDPHLPVHSLAVGQRQRLEILSVLVRGAKVLILDEPTAALGTDEARILGDIIRRFAADGGSVVYISHKLAEVTQLADRVTVMRRGRVVGTHRATDVTVETLAAEMVGEVASSDEGSAADAAELLRLAMGRRMATADDGDAPVVCSLRQVDAPAPFTGESALHRVDLDVRAGEILGVAGVLGSGQTTLAEVLAGFVRPRAGSVELQGAVGYMPENRHRDAVALQLSLQDNLLLYSHRRTAFARGPWFHRGRVAEHVTRVLDASDVRYGHIDHPMSSLSGGNQQKAVVARELEESPRLVVAHNPFRGLDVRAINDVRTALMRAAEAGAGVVLISPDLDELRQLAHRIAVLFAGRVVGEVGVADEDWNRLGQLMGGVA